MWLAYLSDSERRDNPNVFLASADDLKRDTERSTEASDLPQSQTFLKGFITDYEYDQYDIAYRGNRLLLALSIRCRKYSEVSTSMSYLERKFPLESKLCRPGTRPLCPLLLSHYSHLHAGPCGGRRSLADSHEYPLSYLSTLGSVLYGQRQL